MLKVKSGLSTLLYEDQTLSEPTWVGETEFLLLKGTEKGCTALVLADAGSPGSRSAIPPCPPA